MTPSEPTDATPRPALTTDDVRRYRAEFPITERWVFLNHAGMSPTPARSAEAICRWMTQLVHDGRPSFDAWEEGVRVGRERFATLVGADPEEIAFVRNTSHGLSIVASGLDWRPGDRVAVAVAEEYPSNVYPWLDLARRGRVTLDAVDARDGAVTTEAVERVLRPETRLVAVSSAEYASGTVTDLPALGALCRDRGVVLCVDGIQTAGALPVDVRNAGVHALSADSHKWLLGVVGIGGLFVDRALVERIHPPLLGWRSTTDAFDFDRVHLELVPHAGRFEEGSLAYPLIEGFSEVLDLLLEVSVESVAARIRALISRLAEALESLGCDVGPAKAYRQHILTFTHAAASPEALLDGLTERAIVVSLRRGRIRVSPHFYNTEDEMEAVADAVREIVAA